MTVTILKPKVSERNLKQVMQSHTRLPAHKRMHCEQKDMNSRLPRAYAVHQNGVKL